MLHGEDDPSAPLAAVADIAADMPNATLRTLLGGYQLFLDQHDACVQAIAQLTRG